MVFLGEVYILATPRPQSTIRAGRMYQLVDPSRRGNPSTCARTLTTELVFHSSTTFTPYQPPSQPRTTGKYDWSSTVVFLLGRNQQVWWHRTGLSTIHSEYLFINYQSINQILHYTRCITPKRVTSLLGPSSRHCALATQL